MGLLSAEEVNRLVQAGANTAGWDLRVIAAEEGVVTVHLGYAKHMARPGGNIGGPVIMALADAAIYAAVLHELGDGVMAMTTNINCNFLGRAFECDLTGTARLLKAGKRLVVAEVAISDPQGNMVAHATGTYSLPPQGQTAPLEVEQDRSAVNVDRGLAVALADPEEANSAPEPAQDELPVYEVSENEYQELSTSDLLELIARDRED